MSPSIATLIHVRGKNLERMLRRLRKAQAAGEPKINDVEITYDLKTSGVRALLQTAKLFVINLIRTVFRTQRVTSLVLAELKKPRI